MDYYRRWGLTSIAAVHIQIVAPTPSHRAHGAYWAHALRLDQGVGSALSPYSAGISARSGELRLSGPQVLQLTTRISGASCIVLTGHM